jgi:hypothetical protein
MIVSIGTRCSKIAVIALLIAALIGLKPIAFAEAKQTNNGSLSGTFVTANFSFDGVVPATLVSFSGNDNVGGPFTGQEVAEYSVTGRSCTAPDGSLGSVFDLVQSVEVVTYQQGQLYTAGSGALAGSGCQSNTTGSFIISQKHTVTGGTGKFVNASGTYGGTSIGHALAAPGTPPGRDGIFGAFQGTESGSVERP